MLGFQDKWKLTKLVEPIFSSALPLLLSLSTRGFCLGRINKMQHDISKRFDLANTLAHLLAGVRECGCVPCEGVCVLCVRVSELGGPAG